MALRLRRGTDAERQIITPVEGELVYVTDTKELYIGDGTTAGGIKVTGEIADTLDGLTDVDAALPQDGDILVYDSLTSEWEAAQLPLADLPDVDANGITDGQVLAWNSSTQTFVPANNLGGGADTFVGDVIGNVFADDSTLLLNSISKKVYADVVNPFIEQVIVDVSTSSITAINVASDNFVGNLVGTLDGEVIGSIFADDSTLLLSGIDRSLSVDSARSDTVSIGRLGEASEITATRIGPTSSEIILGNDENNEIIIRKSGTTNLEIELGDAITLAKTGETSSEFTVGSGINFDFNSNGFQLESTPNISILSLITEGTARDPLRLFQHSDTKLEAGEIKFQRSRGTTNTPTIVQDSDTLYALNWFGYDGTEYQLSSQILGRVEGTVSTGVVPGRIDFITANSAGITRRNMSIQSDQRLILNGRVFVQGSEFNLDSYNDGVSGGVTFALKRTRGTLNSETTVQNGDEILDISYLAHDGTDFIDTAKIKTTVDGTVSTGVVPSKFEFQVTDVIGNLQNALEISSGRTVTVPGDLNVNGFIDGNFIGSVYADDSSILINAANGSIQVANVDFVGQTGNTPSTPGSVDSWLEVTVNGATKYIPLYT